jgi:hypothetical protein
VTPKYRRWLRTLLLFVYGFHGAVGTNLAFPAYYVIAGISWVDVMIVVTFFGLIHYRDTGPALTTTTMEVVQAALVIALALWLMASTILNAFQFGMETGDLLPAMRLFYFLALTHVIRALVARYGASLVLKGFVAGVFVLAVSELMLSDRIVSGLPLLLNPNVTGALLGLAVWFAALSTIVSGRVVFNLVAVIVLSALSITSFSKGAWLMCACGAAVFATAALAPRRPRRRRRSWQRAGAVMAVLTILVGTVVFVAANAEQIATTFASKLEATTTSGSATLRADLARASWYAGLDYPVFGLGYRNFYQTQFLYPELHLPQLERTDNAHNLFAQTLAVGGFPAATLLLLIVLVPMLVLRRKLRAFIHSSVARTILWTLSFALWGIYGAVELQMIAQPPFWLFCGIVFAIRPPAVQARARHA